MSTISIRKTKDPLHNVFAFIPGEKMNIQVQFGDHVPLHYRLQILDQRNNSRLNRYGKGSEKGFVFDWCIPRTIRDDHFGVWRIQVEADTGFFSHSFFVEHIERIEPPLLFAGPKVMEIPELMVPFPIIAEEAVHIPDEAISVTPSTEELTFVSKTPVTAIKGIGRTYADRLVKIQVYSITEFWHYPDRVALAETMRVSDSRLSKMLQNAGELLNQEVEGVLSTPLEEEVTIERKDLLSIKGIGPKSVEKLEKLGIHSKTDLYDYDDLENLRKTLRISMSKLSNIFLSIGKIVTPVDVTEPETTDPLIQPVTSVKGIGEKSAEKLSQRGIMTVKDLLDASLGFLEGLAGQSTLNKWKQNAAIFAGQEPKGLSPINKIQTKKSELISISGIGIKTAEQLGAAGVFTLNDLVESELEKIVKKTGFSLKRLITWQVQAKKLLD